MVKDLRAEDIGPLLRINDLHLMQVLVIRMSLARRVEHAKARKKPIAEGGVEGAIVVEARERERISAMTDWAMRHNLDPAFAVGIMKSAINESCHVQYLQREARYTKENPDGVFLLETPYEEYRQNLLTLTEQVHETYDEKYATGSFATRAYIDFEHELLEAEVEGLKRRGTLLDLGCATGLRSIPYADRFERVIGYDISAHMVSTANRKAQNLRNVAYETRDLDDGIPLDDGSVSLVIMTLGTAGDIRKIDALVAEIFRVLEPGGRFFLSFYNRQGLLCEWEFLPWTVDLAARVNIDRECLDVTYPIVTFDEKNKEMTTEHQLSVYARAHTENEVRTMLGNATHLELRSYPTMSSILPQEVFDGKSTIQDTLVKVDRSLANDMLGAYIIATGQKP